MPDERNWLQRAGDYLSDAPPDVPAKVVVFHPAKPEPLEIEVSPLVIRDIAGRTHEMPTLDRRAAAKRKAKAKPRKR